MNQEILTIEMVKKDYQKLFVKSVRSLLVISGALLLLIILLLSALYRLDGSKVIGWLVVSPLLFTLYICLSALWEDIRNYRAIMNNAIRIVTDQLESKYKRLPGGAVFASSARPYILRFVNYGDYYIPNGTYYSTSRLHSTNAYGVFSHAQIADRFHVVLNNRNRILAVYNTRQFTFGE